VARVARINVAEAIGMVCTLRSAMNSAMNSIGPSGGGAHRRAERSLGSFM